MRRKNLIASLGIAGAAAAAGVAVPLVNAGPGDLVLPDLVSTAPPLNSAYLMEGAFTGGQGADAGMSPEDGTTLPNGGNRLLVRFDGYVNNEGAGPVDYQGTPASRNMTQYVKRADGSMVAAGIAQPQYQGNLNNDAEGTPTCTAPNPLGPKPPVGPCFIYSTTDSVAASDGHNHWHLVGAATYSLWNEANTAQVGNGQKVGFCLQDSEFIPNRGFTELTPAQRYGYGIPYSMSFCNQGNSSGSNILREGINPGYRDLYSSNLGWQWIDVSDVAPGRYRLGGQVDPNNRVWESDENNPVARTTGTFTIPGWLPVAPAPAATDSGRGVDIALSATAYSTTCKKDPAGGDDGVCQPYTPDPANRQFVVTQGPANGQLTVNGQPVAVGQAFSATAVRYTPHRGVGNVADGFRFAVRDAASAYPLNPPTAAATVNVGNPGPSIVIAGAPTSMPAGTEVDLDASVLNGTGGVSWSVNGDPGGNATVGTITPTGVYRAPARVPAGGSVTVAAAMSTDASVSSAVSIAITSPTKGLLLPVPAGIAGGPSKSKRPSLGKPLVARIGKRVVVKLTPNRSGRLQVTVFSRKKRIRVCTFRKAVAMRPVLCYVNRAGKPGSLRNVRVVAVQKQVRGKPRFVRAVVTKRRI